jgi:ABC-2 type transport system permease protein
VSRAASFPRAAAAQTGVELRLTARRGENLLAMIGIPAALLLFFGATSVLPAPATGTRVQAVLPGILALAIIATGLVNLGIATAFERSYGVLLRLGGSPLGRSGLITAKVATVLVVELVLTGVLVALAAGVLGWRPADALSVPALLAAVILGTATFAGFGLAMAGSLRAEAVLVLANVLFLVVMAIGGVLVPVAQLPGPVGAIATLLPPAALTSVLAGALGGPAPDALAWLVLTVWAVVAVALAIRTFRWD